MIHEYFAELDGNQSIDNGKLGRQLFKGGKGGGGGQTQTSQQSIDPMLRPYVEYGLGEAKNLYQTATPQYYAGQTYVSPSTQTTEALAAAEARARAGNPLVPAAQKQQQNVISGAYLNSNPYFNQALRGASQAAQQDYYDAINKVTGSASQAGRYGSNVMGDLANRAATTMSNTLANKYGDLAFQNYNTERGRQEAAIMNAPTLAAADYNDINKLLQVGQAGEDYKQTALQADIDRFNFEQNKPYAKLQTYLSSVYGAPQGSVTTTQAATKGGGKIVCSMMNEFYGTAPFRNKVWLAQSQRMPNAKTIEKGYHTVFLPLVAFAKKDGFLNKVVRKTLEHIARHRTADVYKEMRNGKRDILGRIYRAVLEPMCYVVGKVKGA